MSFFFFYTRWSPKRISSELKEQSRSWPPFLRWVAWLLSLVLIFGGAFVVFGFAVQFGNDVTYQWMTAVITAFIATVLVTYPCYVMAATLVMSVWCRSRSMSAGDDHTLQDEAPPTLYYDEEREKGSEERPKRPVPRPRRFHPEWYEWHVGKRRQEREMNEVVKELTLYFFYVAVLFIISYGNRDNNAYRVRGFSSQI